jgi:oligoribonuclease NrnB/cAMP/cGMP phosphodiesterase (DHH superfamily)
VKPLVIYHANCWDGFCAAWIARTALVEIEAVPAHYGTNPPVALERAVYVLDFSYPRDTMRTLAHDAERVVVLDHHKTAEAALSGLDEELAPDLTVMFDMSKSGARLTWEYFAGIGGWQGMPTPWLVDYTEDRDLWRHALPNTHEVNAALRSYPLDFDLWSKSFAGIGPPPSSLVQEGAAIRRAEKQIVDSHVRNARLENFDGTHTVPIVNATVLFSEIAGELAKGHPFGACYFDRRDGKRQWSLRSTDDGVDVSEIAKAHGGGGHAHAAGFEQVLP